MSNYTMQIRNVCQALNGYTEEEELFSGFSDVESNISDARSKIFSFTYDFYDTNLKIEFEKKFLRHFYTREIGSETFGLFQLRLKQKFDIIMPYYKELYNSIIPYDIAKQLYETTTEISNGQYSKNGQFLTDLKNTGTQGIQGSNTGTIGVQGTNTGTIGVQGTNTGTVTDQGSNTGTQRNISTAEDKLRYMDTPQGDINIIGGGMSGVADTSGYLTNAHWDNHDTDSTRTDNLASSNTRTDNLSSSSTTTNNLANSSTTTNNLSNSSTRTDNLEAKTTGSNSDSGSDSNVKLIEYCGTHGKTVSELIKEYRDTIINIDESIFNECNDLFMLVY